MAGDDPTRDGAGLAGMLWAIMGGIPPNPPLTPCTRPAVAVLDLPSVVQAISEGTHCSTPDT